LILLYVSLAVFAVLLRLSTIGIPLERDEGAYAYIGSALTRGAVPYRDVFDHKPPLIYAVYAIISLIHDHDPIIVRLVSAVIWLLSVCVLYLLVNAAHSRNFAAASAAIYSVCAGFYTIQGTDLNTEHLLTPILILMYYFGVRACKSHCIRFAFMAGIMTGLAFCAKPNGVICALPVSTLLIYAGIQRYSSVVRSLFVLAAYAFGVFLVVSICLLYFFLAHGMDDLAFDVFIYNREYIWLGFSSFLSTVRLSTNGSRLGMILGIVSWGSDVPPGYGAIFASATACSLYLILKREFSSALLYSGFLLTALVGAKLSAFGFAHYFVPMIPPATILVTVALGLMVSQAGPVLIRSIWSLIAAMVFVTASADLCLANIVFIGLNGDQISATQYPGMFQGEMFAASLAAANAVEVRLGDSGSMYVAGNQPQIYWLARRSAPTKFIYESPVGLIPSAGDQIVHRLSASPPHIIVLADQSSVAVNEFMIRQRYIEIDRIGPYILLALPELSG
jgi:4-amino-4-deoxy-L-arabinose transferase-like glycosyltransferase